MTQWHNLWASLRTVNCHLSTHLYSTGRIVDACQTPCFAGAPDVALLAVLVQVFFEREKKSLPK